MPRKDPTTMSNSSWQVACVAFAYDPPSGRRTPNAAPHGVRTGIAPKDALASAGFSHSDGPTFTVRSPGVESHKFSRGFYRGRVRNAPQSTPDLLSIPRTHTTEMTDEPSQPRTEYSRHKEFNSAIQTSEDMLRAITPLRYRSEPTHHQRSLSSSATLRSDYIDKAGPLTTAEGEITAKNTGGRFFLPTRRRTRTNSPTGDVPAAGVAYPHTSIVVGLDSRDFRANQIASSGMKDQLDDAEYLLPITASLLKTASNDATVEAKSSSPLLPVATLREMHGLSNSMEARISGNTMRDYSTRKHFEWDAPAASSTLEYPIPDPVKREEREERDRRKINEVKLRNLTGKKWTLTGGPVLAMSSSIKRQTHHIGGRGGGGGDDPDVAAVRALR